MEDSDFSIDGFSDARIQDVEISPARWGLSVLIALWELGRDCLPCVERIPSRLPPVLHACVGSKFVVLHGLPLVAFTGVIPTEDIVSFGPLWTRVRQ